MNAVFEIHNDDTGEYASAATWFELQALRRYVWEQAEEIVRLRNELAAALARLDNA